MSLTERGRRAGGGGDVRRRDGAELVSSTEGVSGRRGLGQVGGVGVVGWEREQGGVMGDGDNVIEGEGKWCRGRGDRKGKGRGQGVSEYEWYH